MLHPQLGCDELEVAKLGSDPSLIVSLYWATSTERKPKNKVITWRGGGGRANTKL